MDRNIIWLGRNMDKYLILLWFYIYLGIAKGRIWVYTYNVKTVTFFMIFIGEHIGYIFYKIVWWKKVFSIYLYDIIKDLMNYDIIARKRHITIVSYLWAWVLST